MTMTLPTLYLLLYSFLWFLSIMFFFLRRKKIELNLGAGVLLLYFISSIVSIWIINQNLYYQSYLYVYDIVSFVPLLFLWMTIMLFSAPLLFFDAKKCPYISLCTVSNVRVKKCIVKLFVFIFIVSSILVFIGILRLPNAFDLYSMDSGGLDKKDYMRNLGEVLFSSKVFIYSNKISNIFRDSMLCFAFYMFSKKKNKIGLMLMFCCIVVPAYYSIIAGNRQKLICIMMTFFITYQIFKTYLPLNIRGKIVCISVAVSSCFAIPLILISVLRFGEYFDFLLFSLLRYFGESSINFSSWLFFHVEGQDNGRQILSSLFKDLPFFGHVTSIGPFFYTFVGDLIQAFGKSVTFISGVVVFISSFFAYKNKSGRTPTLGKAILLQTFAIMCYEGLFSFIHWLYIGSFFAGFIWLLLLDTNWLDFVKRIITKIPILKNG